MRFEEFIIKALKVPFAERGRDYNGWDCWGVPFCAFRDVLGVELPEYRVYGSTRDYKHLNRVINGARPLWNKVKQPERMDVAVFKTGKYESHVGLMVDHRKMIHSEAKVGTIIEPVRGLMWGTRLEGIYRYADF